jgi:poly(A) polymerase
MSKDARQIATGIIRTLNKAGHTAYFAGGWVRDYVLGHPSSDIDIATSATPEEVQNLLSHTIPVGAAFGVVIGVVDGVPFEIASFRTEGRYIDGRKPESVSLATAEEDAQRRDFTINGMFFNPLTEEIYDFVGGQEDLKLGVVRAIGDPQERFVEDRLRMIRAVRIAARLAFKIDSATEEAIRKNADTLYPAVSVERVWNELVRMATQPNFPHAISLLQKFGLMTVIFPAADPGEVQQLPEGTPGVLSVLQLMPHLDQRALLGVLRKMKISNAERRLVIMYCRGRDIEQSDRVKWIRFYAESGSKGVLQLLGALHGADWLETRFSEIRECSDAIERIRSRAPVVTSSMLIQEGIAPGPILGQLMSEAESVSITQDLCDPDAIIQQLKGSAAWPT